MNQGPRCVVLMEKNGDGKSHATVPLSCNLPLSNITEHEQFIEMFVLQILYISRQYLNFYFYSVVHMYMSILTEF